MAYTGQDLTFLFNDFIKLALILSVVSICCVLIKNFIEKKRIKKLKASIITDNDFNFIKDKNSIEIKNIFVDNLNPRFELIAKLSTFDNSEFPKYVIDELENISKVGNKSIRISSRILGSLAKFDKHYVGLLLVNRYGPVNLVDHSDFAQSLSKIANKHNLECEIEDYSEIIKKLKYLESEIFKLDGKLIFTVCFHQFPSKIAMNGLAETLKLSTLSESRFVKKDKLGKILFSIVPADYKCGLNLIMDLPRVNEPVYVFQHMIDCGEWLSINFNGWLTDEKGVKIENNSKFMISNQIMNRVKNLSEFGLTPGSNLAMRIFN